MRDREPTVRARELGNSLRQAMKNSGVKANDIVRQLGWSPSRVSRLLSGKRGGSVVDVVAVLALCGVHGPDRDDLIALSQEHEQPNWFQLTPRLRTIIDYENQALAISQFQFNLIPGLLQTEAYVRALMATSPWLPSTEIDSLVETRMGRQKLFAAEHPPKLTFYIHEFALRLPIGGARVMSEQLHKLLRRAVRPNLTLRVVPAAIGAHAAVNGPFRMMEFDQVHPLVYLETPTCSVYLETPDEVRKYRLILGKLREAALDEAESREVIASLVVELYADGEDYEPLE